MTLSTVFRLMAAFMALWGAGMWLAPDMVVGNWNWELTDQLSIMMQFMGTMMLVLAFVQWKITTWAADNLKAAGMAFGCMHTLFLALNVYHLAIGSIPMDATNIGGIVPAAILTILFFVKSR